ncbi:MAG: hypothetical protein M1569_00515 [Candidatus Marsarchaeota archaeon]|nr:hypothetical protein [Candidatus Marsarchaeota archaeon]MCL5412874.1 hypothetical protein [Candidatus Marsarchaeota archaeon]
MFDFRSGIWLYLTVAFSAALVTFAYLRIRKMSQKEQALLIIMLLAGLFIFLFERINPYIIVALEVGILAFNGLLAGKTPKRRTIYALLSLLFIALLHWVGFTLIGQALLLGIISGVTNIREYKNRIVNMRVEIDRDIFHAGIGVFLILLFYFESSPVAITVLIVMILGGIFAISIADVFRSNRAARLVLRLERNGTSLGYGAMWLAIGALIAVSFLSTRDVLAVFSAIFIGDPSATIVGLLVGGKKLPYNSTKSISGTLAYFVATAAIAYFFIGIYALPIAAVAAVVEGVRINIDDNVSVSIALTALLLALRI